MKHKIALLLAKGFEEIEALTPIDVLRRVGCEVVTVGIGGREIVGAHGITVIADKSDSEVSPTEFTDVILPGGMPGAKNLDESDFCDKILAHVSILGGGIAAICASPFILGKRGLLSGKRAVCYPGFEGYLDGAVLLDAPVASDGKTVTAKGMGCALAFSKEILRIFLGMAEEDVESLSKTIMEF